VQHGAFVVFFASAASIPGHSCISRGSFVCWMELCESILCSVWINKINRRDELDGHSVQQQPSMLVIIADVAGAPRAPHHCFFGL
jgi:hypothetical protein